MSEERRKPSPVEDVVIARIVKARGIRGEVACNIETDFPERFDQLERVTVWMPDDTRRSLELEDHWFHKGRVILKFVGTDTMTAAEQLVGGRLVIAEADALELEEDEFYQYALIGSAVVTAEGREVGRVVRLLETGSADLLVVESGDKRELLIPFVDEICLEVDVDARRITVNPPEGLLEL
ncbi:MAG TPA: ribosome maturation factor RimM [Blastocatellia bacterium]|nr:ribosome maturation factor RimM [Blastocatellia bacterium]